MSSSATAPESLRDSSNSERVARALSLRQPLLIARAAGEPADQKGDDQEDHQREEFLRLGDRELHRAAE